MRLAVESSSGAQLRNALHGVADFGKPVFHFRRVLRAGAADELSIAFQHAKDQEAPLVAERVEDIPELPILRVFGVVGRHLQRSVSLVNCPPTGHSVSAARCRGSLFPDSRSFREPVPLDIVVCIWNCITIGLLPQQLATRNEGS